MSTPYTVETLRAFLASVCDEGCGERLVWVGKENHPIASTVATVCWLPDGVHLRLGHPHCIVEERHPVPRLQEEDDDGMEAALCGLRAGSWRIDMDEYKGALDGHAYASQIALFSGRIVIGHNPSSQALAHGAKTLAELAEQVKARGF